MDDIRSYAADLHYPEPAKRYYMTYVEAIVMLLKNVYRDEELMQLKASQMLTVVDIMSFAAVFFLRCCLAVLSPVIAPIFMYQQRYSRLRLLRTMFYLSSYTYGHEKAYVLIKSKLARWTR